MMAWGTRVKGTSARSATCPVYDAFCPPKTTLRTADAPAVSADKGRSFVGSAIREVGDNLVAVLLEVVETVIEQDGVRVVVRHRVGQRRVEIGTVQIAVGGAELGHE